MTLKTYFVGLSLLTNLVAGEAFAATREEMIPLGTDARAEAEPSPARGPTPRVELFAQARLGNRDESAARPVRSCGARERVAALRFRALVTAAYLRRAEVIFGNGARQRLIPLGRTIAANSDTGWIPLSRAGGRNPCVRAVKIRGQNGYLTPDSSVVQIFGLIAEARPKEEARRGRALRAPGLTLSQANP